MLSSAPLRPARPAPSIANSVTIRSAGVGSVSPSGKRAAKSETQASIVVALASSTTLNASSTSTSSSKATPSKKRSSVIAAAAASSKTTTPKKRSSVIAAAAPKKASPTKKKGGREQEQIPVDYGRDWFAATRDPSRGLSPRQEMERRRAANRAANNGLERKDLYTDAWAGSEFRGSSNNILTWLIVVSVAVPALGLLFAWQTYGTLWG